MRKQAFVNNLQSLSDDGLREKLATIQNRIDFINTNLLATTDLPYNKRKHYSELSELASNLRLIKHVLSQRAQHELFGADVSKY